MDKVFASKKDIELKFVSATKVSVSNSAKVPVTKEITVSSNPFKKGKNTISFEMSKNGYIVKINDAQLKADDAKDDNLMVTSLDFAKMDQIIVKGLTATVTVLVIDASG